MVRNQIIHPIRLGDMGLNLYNAPEWLLDGEALLAQNCYWRRGQVMKLGSLKHSANEVTAAKAIVGLHRFYFGTTSRHLIAAAGTNVKRLNEDTGAWVDIRITQTDGKETFISTWAAVGKAYIANGTDAPFSWDGTTAATLGAFPVTTKMFLPYRDRLLFVDSATPQYIRRTSGSTFSDAALETLADSTRITSGGAIEVIAPHVLAGPQEGIIAYVFVATGSSIALMSGTNLIQASSDIRLDHISDIVGCVSPRSVVSTPKGTIFLGSDLQVYLLPYGSGELIPIGHKIQSQSTGTIGIESIPLAQLSKAAAAYHDGLYKLSFAVSGGTSNTRQYWLDVSRLAVDERGFYGPWYGPMIGMGISMFANQNGPGDDGRLIGGEAGANGFVYRVNEPSIFTDNGANITMYFQGNHEIYGKSPGNDVVLTRTELEMTDPAGTVNLSFHDTNGPIGTAIALGTEQTGTYWGDADWGDQYWQGSSIPVRRLVEHFDKYLVGRGIAVAVEYTSGIDGLSLFFVQNEARPVRQVFQKR